MEPKSLLKSRNIVLADDHKILRAGLKKLIGESARLHVSGEAGSGKELLKNLENTPCDLLILDLSMPELDGLKTLETIRMKYPGLKVIILTMHNSLEYFKEAISRGVEGYLLKEDVYENLLEAIEVILGGGTYFSTEMKSQMNNLSDKPPSDPTLQILTSREFQILDLVAVGETSKAIAKKLKISERTVETHRSHIMDKLKVRNVAELVKFAVSRGLGAAAEN